MGIKHEYSRNKATQKVRPTAFRFLELAVKNMAQKNFKNPRYAEHCIKCWFQKSANPLKISSNCQYTEGRLKLLHTTRIEYVAGLDT